LSNLKGKNNFNSIKSIINKRYVGIMIVAAIGLDYVKNYWRAHVYHTKVLILTFVTFIRLT